jgi:hypothetical protein
MLLYNTYEIVSGNLQPTMTKPQTAAPLSSFSASEEARRLMETLAGFVNAQATAQRSPCSFHAMPPDMSLQGAPTFATEVRTTDGRLAGTYKFNYFFDLGTSSWLFFPLVIQWADNAQHRSEGMDCAMIEHCLSNLRGFFAQRPDAPAARPPCLTMASGYLTTQRGGRTFFERMGWVLHSFGKKDGLYPELEAQPAPLQFMARRIDEISMPFRTDAEEAKTLCFAVIDL